MGMLAVSLGFAHPVTACWCSAATWLSIYSHLRQLPRPLFSDTYFREKERCEENVRDYEWDSDVRTFNLHAFPPSADVVQQAGFSSVPLRSPMLYMISCRPSHICDQEELKWWCRIRGWWSRNEREGKCAQRDRRSTFVNQCPIRRKRWVVQIIKQLQGNTWDLRRKCFRTKRFSRICWCCIQA